MNHSKRICFVLPEFSNHTHFTYVAEMIETLSYTHSIFLIVEKGELRKNTSVQKIYLQKFNFFPLRVIENFLVLLYTRICGYKHTYIHYSFVAAINASLIARISGGKTYYWNAGLPWQYKRTYIREKFEEATYHLISYLVTATESLGREYAHYYGLNREKIKIIPNWIDSKAFTQLPATFSREEFRKKLNISPDQKVVLFVHRLAKRKGAHFLPDIAEAVKAEHAVLVIVGDGPERDILEANIINRKLSDAVRICGWASQEEVKKYFANADLFIMPSEEEGFPHVILEAMAAHVPFVAFDVGGMQDIITPVMKPYVYMPNDIKSFTRGVSLLLNNQELRTTLIASGKQRVKDFSKEKVTQEFIHLFE